MVDDNQRHGQSNPSFRRHIPVAISILIAALWVVFLRMGSRPFDSSGSALIGLVPVVFAAVWRTSRVSADAKGISAREQRAGRTSEFKNGQEATRVKTDQVLGEAASTVPFSQTQLSIVDEFTGESEADSSDFARSDEVTHWFTRSKTIDGEIIEGGARVEFADGQRDVTVHIAFCPPLACVPTIDTEDLDGNGLEIRVAATFPFGARLTVRRPVISKSERQTNSTQSGRIGFVAITSNVRRVA